MMEYHKMKKPFVLLFTFILTFSIGASVLADDDEHEKREHEQHGEYYEKSDDEEYEDGNFKTQGTTTNTVIQDDYWYIWSRQPINNSKKSLPITAPSELAVNVNGSVTKLYFIPQEGQLLVSCDAVANLLGAQAKYYPQSKIMVITKDKSELVVRAGSNAAYENRVRNPMPVMAATYENTLYVPVSVITNAMGYRLNWDPGSNTLICVSI